MSLDRTHIGCYDIFTIDAQKTHQQMDPLLIPSKPMEFAFHSTHRLGLEGVPRFAVGGPQPSEADRRLPFNATGRRQAGHDEIMGDEWW